MESNKEITITPEEKLSGFKLLVKKMRYYQNYWYVHGGFDNKKFKVMYEGEVDKILKEKK